MSWRLTLALWLAALVVGAASLAVAARGPVRPASALRPLLDDSRWNAERVTTIAIERPGRATIVLERRGDGWIEREPSGLAADPFQVQAALAAAGALRVSRAIAPSELATADARRGVGLDPPEAIVTFGGDDGDTTLRLGRPGVAGRAFIELSERGAHGGATSAAEAAVVGQELHEAIVAGDPAQWRLRSLLPDAGATTTGIEYVAGETSLRLARSGGRWTMERPVATRVDQTAVGAYLDALARSECAEFLEDLPDDSVASLARFGLAEPAAQLSLTSDDGSTRRIAVGAPIAVGGTERFGFLAGHRATMRLDAPTMQALFVNPATLIDPTASGVAIADVKSIVISGPKGDFSLVRDLDRWVSPEAEGAAASSKSVDELLRRLTVARAGSIVLKPIARERMVGRIELRGFEGSTLAAIDVAADGARANYALDAGDGVARVFPAAQAPELVSTAYGLPATRR